MGPGTLEQVVGKHCCSVKVWVTSPVHGLTTALHTKFPPSCNKLVEQSREEQHHTEVLKNQLDAGDSYEKKGSRERDLKIRDVVLEYNSNDMPGFLEKLALVLSRE